MQLHVLGLDQGLLIFILHLAQQINGLIVDDRALPQIAIHMQRARHVTAMGARHHGRLLLHHTASRVRGTRGRFRRGAGRRRGPACGKDGMPVVDVLDQIEAG